MGGGADRELVSSQTFNDTVTNSNSLAPICFVWVLWFELQRKMILLHIYYCLSSCRFRWTKNGQEFDPLLDPRLMKEENSGTFVIPNNGNLTEYQGTYRCYASNKLGTAISKEIEFIVPSE